MLTVVLGDGSKIAEILALVFTVIATVLASVQKVEKADYTNEEVGVWE